MEFETYDYAIAEHFVCPIEYGDYSGLEDSEIAQLERFLEQLPINGHWSYGDEASFQRDEISGLYGNCLDCAYHVPKSDD